MHHYHLERVEDLSEDLSVRYSRKVKVSAVESSGVGSLEGNISEVTMFPKTFSHALPGKNILESHGV